MRDMAVLATKIEREVFLRVLTQSWEERTRQHPELAAVLIHTLDQYLVEERVAAGLYDEAVQEVAARTMTRMETRGTVPVLECAVCDLKGWRSHE